MAEAVQGQRTHLPGQAIQPGEPSSNIHSSRQLLAISYHLPLVAASWPALTYLI